MKRAKILEPVLILLAVLVGFLWLVNTLNTGNPLWFFPVQPIHTPSRIVVHYYGESHDMRAGSEHFAELEAALNTTLSSFRNTALVSIGLSEDTLNEYYNEQFVVEVFYPGSVEFNTPVRTSGVNVLLFPIDSRHDDQNYVFMASNREYRAGALQVDSQEALVEALAAAGVAIQE